MSETGTFTPWTEDGATRLREAAREVAERIEAHSAELVGLAHDDFHGVFAANDRLSEALIAYADAQFDYCGNPGPLGLVSAWNDDDADDDVEEPTSSGGFAVLQRCDYEVTDEAAILSAGIGAYRKSWPDASESEAAADVTHLGRALYHVAHEAGTWDALRDATGLRVTGSTTRVAAVETTLGPDPDAWPADPFDLGDIEVIYSVSDVDLS
jgi:hypothetical protein